MCPAICSRPSPEFQLQEPPRRVDWNSREIDVTDLADGRTCLPKAGSMNHLTTEPDASTKVKRDAARIRPWLWNRRVGWISACLGVASGTIIGLWSFDGPVPVPAWLGEYGATPRRMARLGHIAFLGLGILDLLLAHELPRSALSDRGKRIASWAMIFGNLVLPVTLFAAAAYHPLKYVLPVPVTAVFIALLLVAYGACTGKTEVGPGHEEPQ
jgi:hypothetical protein